MQLIGENALLRLIFIFHSFFYLIVSSSEEAVGQAISESKWQKRKNYMPRNLLRRKPFCRKVQFMCTNLAPALPSVTRRKTKDPADPIKCAYLATAPKGRSENFFPLPLFQKLILFILFLLAFHHVELEERGGGGKKKYVFVPLPPGTEVLKVATKIGRPPFFFRRVAGGGWGICILWVFQASYNPTGEGKGFFAAGKPVFYVFPPPAFGGRGREKNQKLGKVCQTPSHYWKGKGKCTLLFLHHFSLWKVQWV